jgi:hypothetical protein
MKKITSAMLLFCVAILTITSCKKKDDNKTTPTYTCTTCVTKPDALAANDASSKGIYKGVVIGSSGTIKFDISNNNSTITATMVIDGTTVQLTSNVTWTNGQSYIAPFTGTLNGAAVTINFKVDANGGNPIVTSADIPGHPNATFDLVKETSNALIECFEGTYSTTEPETGTFNILLSRTLGKWGGESRKTGSTTSNDASGTIDQNGVMKDDEGHTIGTLSGDNISGSFQNEDNNTVTVSGHRTL